MNVTFEIETTVEHISISYSCGDIVLRTGSDSIVIGTLSEAEEFREELETVIDKAKELSNI